MSYTFLLESGEESSVEFFSDIPPYVLSKLNLIEGGFCFKDNGMESCHGSQSGTTLKHSTEHRGEEKLMPSVEGFHARTSASQAEERASMEAGVGYGKKCEGWFAKWDQKSCSWKTPQCSFLEGLDEFLETWPRWGIMLDGDCFPVGKSVVCICENASSFTLPTPGKNEFKGSSRKRFIGSQHFRGAKMSEGLRICETDPTYLNPSFAELVMGYPLGWTDLQPLGMARFQEWLKLHGNP